MSISLQMIGQNLSHGKTYGNKPFDEVDRYLFSCKSCGATQVYWYDSGHYLGTYLTVKWVNKHSCGVCKDAREGLCRHGLSLEHPMCSHDADDADHYWHYTREKL